MEKEREEVEIDFLELGRKLWDNKKFIIKCSAIGAIVGLIIAFSIPKEYKTTVILVTGANKTPGGSMGALASMAGINLGNNSIDEIFSQELYPDVLNSTPFVQGLLNINVSDENQNIDTSLYYYFKDHQSSAWYMYLFKAPYLFIELFTSDKSKEQKTNVSARFISEEELDLIEVTKSAYSISTDKKTGVTTINVKTQSPKISAFLADTLTSYLQKYIIEQRTKKANTNLLNSEKLYQQAKADYYNSQEELATFVDGNMNVTSARYRINQEKLQNESNLTYSTYNQMAQQVQMNKIKVQDDTPVFTIIQPAIEPLTPSNPKKKLIVFGSILMSVVCSIIWLIKEPLSNQIKKFKI